MTTNETAKPICIVSINSISGNNVGKMIVLSVCYRDHQSQCLYKARTNEYTQVQQYSN